MTGERDGGGEKRWPYLPSGYYLDKTTNSDAVMLRREDGSEVAAFSSTGVGSRELLPARRGELLFLLAYSPDLNPIEEAFSKVKASLRRAGARIREALVEALGSALDEVTAEDTQGFFEHCGYRFSAQPL